MLVADPSVILLDEPAGGVNPTLIGQMAERIAELNRQGRSRSCSSSTTWSS